LILGEDRMVGHTDNKIVISRSRLSSHFTIFLLTCLISLAFSPNVSWAASNPPSDLTVTAVSSSQIDLSWKDNSIDESGFSIERKTGVSGKYSVIGSVEPNVTTYSGNNLIQTTKYYYRVRAISGSTYSGYSNEVNTTTLAMNPPSSLNATAVS
jgi:hypothetical protein